MKRRKVESFHYDQRGEHELWLIQKVDARWTAYGRIFGREGQLVIGELHIVPSTVTANDLVHRPRPIKEGEVPPGGLETRILRELPVQKLLTEFIQGGHHNWEDFYGDAWWKTVAPRIGLTRIPRQKRPVKPTIINDSFLAELASQYVALIATGSRSPVREIAQSRGKSPETIRSLLNDARHAKLLSAPPTGRAGGKLTNKAKKLLEKKLEPKPARKGSE